MNYYNDNDPKKAAWLRVLIEDKLVPPGDVDERGIEQVHASDLIGYTQHHFFAGIGGWSKALRLARWPENRPVCTASCPCQPFSQTGKHKGFHDTRHLWPTFFSLLKQARFPVVFGEQVSSPDGLLWLDRVCADLEDQKYEIEAVDLCAAGVSAPQARQRLFWVAFAGEAGQQGSVQHRGGHGPVQDGSNLRLGHADSTGSQGRVIGGDGGRERTPWSAGVGVRGDDGKLRRIEPGILPLAHGVPDRVALIGGAGDAIVPILAAEFIQACEEARNLQLVGVG